MAAEEGIKAMKKRLNGLHTDKARLNGLAFSPRSTDVIIVTTPKAGTTWLQQIVHQLRTGGDMSFDEISQVVPFLEFAGDLGVDIDAEQSAVPRCYKTHCWYNHCPKGAGKYILCVREPCAVAYSFFNFFKGWFFQPGEISVEEFVREFWLARGVPQSKLENASYFHHLASWWPHRNENNVLLLFYEDMKSNPEAAVRAVAKHIGISNESHIRVALERSSLAYMKKHERKFDEHVMKNFRNEACGLPKNAGEGVSTKVNTGSSVDGRRVLSADLKKEIQKKWDKVVYPVTNCATYEDLRLSWNAAKHGGDTEGSLCQPRMQKSNYPVT